MHGRIAERGLFDMIFFGAGSIPKTWEGGIDVAVRRGVAWLQPRHELLDHGMSASWAAHHAASGPRSGLPIMRSALASACA
jgi:hypothetical protein